MAKKKVSKKVTKKVESSISDREYGHLKIIAIDNNVQIKGKTREELQQDLIDEGFMQDPNIEVKYGDPTQHVPTAPDVVSQGGGVIEVGNSPAPLVEESDTLEKSEAIGQPVSGVSEQEVTKEEKKPSTNNKKGQKFLTCEDVKGLHVSEYIYLGKKNGVRLYKLR